MSERDNLLPIVCSLVFICAHYKEKTSQSLFRPWNVNCAQSHDLLFCNVALAPVSLDSAFSDTFSDLFLKATNLVTFCSDIKNFQ